MEGGPWDAGERCAGRGVERGGSLTLTVGVTTRVVGGVTLLSIMTGTDMGNPSEGIVPLCGPDAAHVKCEPRI